MDSKGKYYQLIPEKIFQELPTIGELIKPEIKGFQLDYLKQILSIIACHIQKDSDETPLKMLYIKKIVPQGDKYLKGLIDLDIVKRSGRAVIGEACYKYSFTEDYKSKYISLPLDNQKLILRIEKAGEDLRKEGAKNLRTRREQICFLKQLTIDNDYTEILPDYQKGTDQYNFLLASATRIINEDIYYSVDATSGRFHSNVTNLSKALRPYLRIKGEPLVNIDIKNSQPYLSTIILTNPGKVSCMTENPVFALLLQTLKVSLNEDVKEYIFLVVSGRLYESLMKDFNLTRDETKVQLLRILFARNRMPKDGINRKCRMIFKERFPTVYRTFNKVRGYERGDKFNNFKRFAILLQRIEAFLMLDVILKRIYKELPGTVAITIHDSIMTGILTDNVKAVRKIMTEELTKFTGFRPQIKIEDNKRILRVIREENKRLYQYDATTLVSIN